VVLSICRRATYRDLATVGDEQRLQALHVYAAKEKKEIQLSTVGECSLLRRAEQFRPPPQNAAP
jgi:hypothetical protein